MSAICLYTSEKLSSISLNDLICVGGGGKFIRPLNVGKAVWPFPVSHLANMKR